MERNSRRTKKVQATEGAETSTGHMKIVAMISVEFVKSCVMSSVNFLELVESSVAGSVKFVKSRETG